MLLDGWKLSRTLYVSNLRVVGVEDCTVL